MDDRSTTSIATDACSLSEVPDLTEPLNNQTSDSERVSSPSKAEPSTSAITPVEPAHAEKENAGEPPEKKLRTEEHLAVLGTEEEHLAILRTEEHPAVSQTDLRQPETTIITSEEITSQQQHAPTIDSSASFRPLPIDCTQAGHLLCSSAEFETNNYFRGCKWSPDGSCLLTCSNDNCMRLFNTPDDLYDGRLTGIPNMTAVLKMKEAECIYDYAWYPKMHSSDPASCFYVSVCRDNPIHIWDAHSGDLRCSYRPHDHLDELVSPYSLTFSPNGKRLLCGFYKAIRVFDVNRPGKECQTRKTFDKQGQSGIISCIAVNPTDQGMYAAGSYNKSIGLYSEPKGDLICMLQGHRGGVTHLMFSPDGTKLFSGARKDSEILCWDVRNPGQVVFSMQRPVRTNQRIYFDVDFSGQFIVSGGHDGVVSLWDSSQCSVDVEEELLMPSISFNAHQDCVNGVSVNPMMPLLATTSGQRHPKFPSPGGSSSESEEEQSENVIDNSVKLWWLGNQKKDNVQS